MATINLSDLFDGSIYITATKQDDDTYRLYWHDGVAGEWEETYPTLSVALARAAVLAACGETKWDALFTEAPDTFPTSAAAFLATQTG